MNRAPNDYIKGKADVFSFVLGRIDVRGKAGVAFACADILKEIHDYVNLPFITTPTEDYVLGVIDAYDHFVEYFTPVTDVIPPEKVKYIYNGIEGDFEKLVNALAA